MIKQVINVNNKWKVIVYYDIDYNLFPYINQELYKAGITTKEIERIYNKISIVGFNTHKTRSDYISSIAHEAEHVKQAMLDYYGVDDADEPPAYTIGFLLMKMLQVFDNL